VVVGALEGPLELPAGGVEIGLEEAGRGDGERLLGGAGETGDERVVIQRRRREQLGLRCGGGGGVERPGGGGARLAGVEDPVGAGRA
jgi:hypothetical protein